MNQVGAYLKAADVLLVHLRKDPLFEITIPSKTQTYMFIGKPLLMALNGDAADLVKQSSGGLVVESENPQALVRAAEQLAHTSLDELAFMGQQAKVFYQHNLALKVGVMYFAQLFNELASKGK
jgi:glycosyltransferase involved in cell wall biosynthesis